MTTEHDASPASSPRATPGTLLAMLAAAALSAGLLAGCGERAPEHPGQAVYLKHCFACHASGAAGAPRFGDAPAWRERLAKGDEALLASVVDGMPPGMPAKGLCDSCDDEALREATDYLLRSVRD